MGPYHQLAQHNDYKILNMVYPEVFFLDITDFAYIDRVIYIIHLLKELVNWLGSMLFSIEKVHVSSAWNNQQYQ